MARRSSADRRHRPVLTLLPLAASLLLAAAPAAAMQALDDHAMAQVNGQDGLEVDISSATAISSVQQKWITDAGAAAIGACTGGVANQHACTIINGLSLSGVSPAPLGANFQLDVGSNAANGGDVQVAMALDWDPIWIKTTGVTLATPTVDSSARSIGAVAIQSDGYLKLSNRGGIFNNGGNFASLDFSSDGDVFLRQGGPGSPELSFGDFLLTNRFTTGAAGGHLPGLGKIALDNNGLLVSAPFAYAELLFNVLYKANPVDFDLGGRQSMTLFGWTGGLKDPLFRLSPGGVSYNTYAATGQNVLNPATSYTFQGGGTRSEGLSILAQWDFDTDFNWIIGQAGGNQTQVLFSNWRRLGTTSTAPVLYMPVTLDIMQNNVGPAGLCLGGGFTSGVPVQASCTAAGGSWLASGVPAGKAAFALMLRDAHLWGYNQKVEVRDPTIGPATQYNWSLLYTFGKMDGDIFVYPEGRGTGLIPSTTATGIKIDATVMAQSPGYWEKAHSAVLATRQAAASNWDTNTNFMLADTAVGGGATQFGVGLINADLTWRARDLYLRVISGDPGYPELPGGLWLQTDTGQRYFMRGLIGGGLLSNLSQPTALALASLDLSTNRFIFVLSPQPAVGGDAPIGFDGIIDLDGTASFTLAEVANPSSAFYLTNVQGRVGWQDGTITVRSGQNTPSGRPSLTFDNDLLFGREADYGSGGGAALIGNIGFGSENYGRIILPGGIWHSEFSLVVPST